MAKRVKADLEYWYENNIDLASRTILITDPDDGDISASTAAYVMKGLHILENSYEAHKPITLILNSTGGTVEHGLAIYDAIKLCKVPVHIKVRGQCCSIAAAILQAGDHRTATPNSWIMVHDGDVGEGKTQVGDLGPLKYITDRQKEQYYRILASNSYVDVRGWEQRCDRDYWMSAQDALELGLIDEIEEFI